MFYLDFRGSDQLDIIVAQTLVDSMFVKKQAAQREVVLLAQTTPGFQSCLPKPGSSWAAQETED